MLNNTPPCTEANVQGGLIEVLESAGFNIEPRSYSRMPKPAKAGYTNAASKRHSKGTSQEYGEFMEEVAEYESASGNNYKTMANAYFRHADRTVGEEYTNIVGDGVQQWQQEVISKNMSKPEAQKAWAKIVKPKAEEAEALYFSGKANVQDYTKQRVDTYFRDMKSGDFVFKRESNPVTTMARRAAGFVTGYDTGIAMLDYMELVFKGVPIHNPINFTVGVGKNLLKNGVKAFGRVSENEGLYFDMKYRPEKTGLKEKAEWLSEHLNPQYYSNNFLVNSAAEMGRVSGMGARESVEKIAFIPRMETMPEYLRNGAGEITWARYSTEAFKFYLEMHGNLGRAVLNRDPKAFVSAAGTLGSWYALTSALTGVKSSAPPVISEFMSAVTKDSNEEDIFDQMDKAFPVDLVHKATGLDVGDKTSQSVPLFGLAYSYLTSQSDRVLNSPSKIIEYIKADSPAKAWKLGLSSAFFVGTLKFGPNPILNKSLNDFVNLAVDVNYGEVTPEQAQKETIKNFTGIKP